MAEVGDGDGGGSVGLKTGSVAMGLLGVWDEFLCWFFFFFFG